ITKISSTEIPPYVKQCHEEDPKLIDCYIKALHHLKPYLANGIPEIELPSVEPFQMDELSLSLTTGPNGYRVSLTEMDIYGASNFTVTKLKLSENGKPFEAVIKIPYMKILAKYASTGVLIILPASGNGTFHGSFEDATAIVRGKVSNSLRDDGLNYLHVDTLNVDLNVRMAKMAVKKVFNNNRILIEATNLFLRENGNEVLKAMTPQLRKKLSVVFQNIANQLLTHVPVQTFLVSKAS
ncbi:uncharacterized protein LOC123291745, partial [Chrysoperla carnea]|uniref:uncharacterized protein LOC123291745 n=1 Tax=Chrysoperla carnea TaxID=189513 RepID=UPI001D068369